MLRGIQIVHFPDGLTPIFCIWYFWTNQNASLHDLFSSQSSHAFLQFYVCVQFSRGISLFGTLKIFHASLNVLFYLKTCLKIIWTLEFFFPRSHACLPMFSMLNGNIISLCNCTFPGLVVATHYKSGSLMLAG